MFYTYIESFSFASDIGSQKLELCIWTYFELFGYRPDTEIGVLFIILLHSQNYGSQLYKSAVFQLWREQLYEQN